jgi:dTDP-glucose 4,6-dehydratase
MRILVTGAAGFIGSNFVRWHFERSGIPAGENRLVALDALTYAGNLENLQGLDQSYDFRFVKGDIRDCELVDSLLKEEKIDAVINFAAESHVDRSILDPLSFVRTNIEGTQLMIEASRKAEVSRYLQISTDEVYGSLGPTGRFSESSPLDPSSAYSASKTGADLLVIAANRTHGFPSLVTRCSNNYGPYQFPEKLIPLMITNALNDQALPVYGDGKQVRSWLHVDDHSRAIYLVLTRGRPGNVYNIGGAPESEKENIEVVRTILEHLGKPDSLIRWVEDRKGHDRRYAVDYSKITQELGWEPQIGFSKGMKSTIDWYLQNKDWWSRVKSGEYLRFYESYYGALLAQGQ